MGADSVGARAPDGFTPTEQVYSKLERYIGKHRPQYVITITDGQADDKHDVENMNAKLRRHTRMVAFGVAEDQPDEEQM